MQEKPPFPLLQAIPPATRPAPKPEARPAATAAARDRRPSLVSTLEIPASGTYTASSVATGINARGWVVGNGDNMSRAFFWDPARGMFVFLSDDPSQAHDVNHRGEVVGWIGNFVREAVIWRVRP